MTSIKEMLMIPRMMTPEIVFAIPGARPTAPSVRALVQFTLGLSTEVARPSVGRMKSAKAMCR